LHEIFISMPFLSEYVCAATFVHRKRGRAGAPRLRSADPKGSLLMGRQIPPPMGDLGALRADKIKVIAGSPVVIPRRSSSKPPLTPHRLPRFLPSSIRIETAAGPFSKPLGEFIGGIRQCDNDLVDVGVSCAVAAFVTGIVLAAASLI
jgi:hypothetical protein